VDVVVFTIEADTLKVALVQRGQPPHEGQYALPGGFVREDEDLDTAARRELNEETKLKPALPLIAQFRAYGAPHRDPRMRVVTIAFWAIVPAAGVPRGGGDAFSAHFISVDAVLAGKILLAFDHRQILEDALEEARRALETTTVATGFCTDEFTIPDLRRVYEIVWGTELDPGNFQKKVTGILDFVIPTGTVREGGPGRPAETYIAGTARVIDPPFRRPTPAQGTPTIAPGILRTDLAADLPFLLMEEPKRFERKPPPTYPLLDRHLFDQLPKAKKVKDVQRMLHSSQSEDWVTWNVVRLLSRRPWKTWWPHLMELVSQSADEEIDLPTPTNVDLWKTVPAPLAYERASRERMRASDNRSWQDRALNPKPVEGETEVEVSLEGASYLVYVEAKLGSDISARTTYDPYRNQVVRNIDCVLEYRKKRRPYFWMFARDRGPERSYIQLLKSYRREPKTLAEQLPHRSGREIDEVSRTLAVVTWSDLLDAVTPDDREERVVYKELQRRARSGR
jgi:8-oxo-dGTP diphosphatase